jgi:hypothetical protein
MTWQPKDLLPFIQDYLQQENVRHEVDIFDSGAAMVDIWIEEKFYVIQLDELWIGLSLIRQDEGLFDVIPDRKFYDNDSFKNAFKKIF